jgi:putative hemolysin secretion transport system membrane protein
MENFDYMEIRSEEFQEILGQRPRWVVRYGIILLIVFMIILLGGAWLFKYPQTIEGKLVLTSSIPTVQLESKVTGIITDVYVKDGQKVEQGEKLALIQNTANVNDIELLEKNIAEWYHAVDNGKVC